jgi:hypothetical protein
MSFCPECKSEYLDDVSNCEDCGIPLVEFLLDEEEDPDLELVEIWCAPNEIEAQMVKALLEGNRITCLLSGESLRHTHGIMVDGLAEVRILVRSDEVKRAEEIINDYRKNRST